MKRFVAWMFPLGMMVLGAGMVFGQNYPIKPIRIVASAAGGSGDFAARLIGQGLTGALGQQVVVDNRGGVIPSEIGMFAPARTPAAIIDRLSQEIARVLTSAEVKERFFNAGVETVGSTPEEFAAAIRSNVAKWGKLIKDAGIRGE